ncbi:MAG: rhomboid family intramembrane serine protease [Cytophagaceae bacterium]|nr:rhomboid family intramembrane serine protease [Cytophagaceae bacterium]
MTITLIIIIATVGASFYAWSKPEIYEKWMMIPYRVKRNKEFYRFLTSGFIHSGYVHLGFNMMSFYFFAKYVELALGPIAFVCMYLMAIVVSDIPTYLKQQNNYGYRSLGASGGVSAIIFSSIIMNPLSEIYLFLIPIPISGFIFGILYLIYSYYQAKNSQDNIGHEAHFYGAVFGVVFTIIIYPQTLILFFERISNWSLPF